MAVTVAAAAVPIDLSKPTHVCPVYRLRIPPGPTQSKGNPEPIVKYFNNRAAIAVISLLLIFPFRTFVRGDSIHRVYTHTMKQ